MLYADPYLLINLPFGPAFLLQRNGKVLDDGKGVGKGIGREI